MARTDHHRHSTPDPIRTIWKMERKARPAGRIALCIQAHLDELGEDDEDGGY